MQKKVKIIFYFLLIPFATFAQEKDNCNCTLNLKEIITDIESNYPGYKTKTNNGNLLAYLTVKKDALKIAEQYTDRETCFYTIANYLSFFKDNHIIFSDRKITPKQALLNNNSNKVNQLTGLWFRASDSLTIRIIKIDKQTHRAYILKSTNNHKEEIGKVHFDLIGNENEFRIRKYAAWLTTDLLRGRRLNQLIIEPDGIWQKITPGVKNPMRKTSLGTSNKTFAYKLLDSQTYYLGIPAFNINEKKFDSLIVNEIIPTIVSSKTKHLIIDLRNNVGGNSSFLFLVRLLYDKPFALPGDFIFSTPDIISKYQKLADAGSKYHQLFLPKLISNSGGFVQRDSLKLKLKEIYEYPKKISILVNENCASSTEYFLKIAQYSSRVKIFGRHTAGTSDYSELFQPEKLSCAGYSYMRPTTKSFWTDTAPIDNKGIYPDVDLSKHPDDEWLSILMRENF